MSTLLNKTISIILTAALLIPSFGLFSAVKAAGPDIPVMLYHRIVANATDDWTHTSIENFSKQMKYLSDNGYTTLSAKQYVSIREGKETAPEKPILLTFDDATPDFITNALPILKQYGMNSVQFVVSDWIDGGYSMTSEQLRALAAEPSVSLQNHSKTHNNDTANGGVWTTAITKEQASAEISAAAIYLKGITGEDPMLFAYPYGAFNANAEAAAQENGIKYAFKVGYPDQSHYAVGRHYMMRGTTLSEFAAMVGGPPLEEAPAEEVVTVYRETFADGQGIAVQSGGAALTPVTGKVFAGNEDGAALYVSSRENNWDAADFSFSDMGLTDGKTYTVSVSVYVDGDVAVPSGAEAYLQTIESYELLANVSYEAGSALTLTKEFTVDTSKDSKLRVQSSESGKTVPFYIGEMIITEKVSSGGENPVPETPRDPALPFTTIDFEDQAFGGFTGRAGTETLTVTDEANHTDGGSYALKVEGRTNTWHGPALRVEKFVDKGHEYRISAWVKLISPASSQLQLSTQVGTTSPSYNNITSKTVSTEDGWVLLEGTYRYNTISDEYLSIYVESNNSTASYYIDDIRFESTDSGPITIEKDLAPIKDVYQHDFLIGNAVSAADLEGVRAELLQMHHNVATAENAMKPDAMQPTKGNFTFDAADTIVDKVLAAGLQMHGHVLVWHQQTPAWMNTITDAENNTIPMSREEALANMRTHIRTVMEHYGEKMISWDVVNEAMIDNPPNPADWQAALRKSAWYQAIGPDYVEQAFLAAREVLDENGWDIKLYYNDYNDDNQNKAHAIYSMVKEINEKYAQAHGGKLLIDGIGMQAHYNASTNPNNVKMSLEKFISLGVEVSVTELDIQAGSNGELTEQQAKAQGYLYAQLFKLYKTHAEHIARITLWGLNDATSWRAANSPLLFDKDLQAKPAYYGVIQPDKFMEENPPIVVEANQGSAVYATPVVDGTVDGVWSRAAEMPVNRYQTAWQGASGVAKALWDDQNLYVLIQVSDSQLDKSNPNAWEQDSVEIFLDQNNGKTSFYQEDDGQYRVNFDNEASFNPERIADGFASAAKVNGSNYTVEVKIPLKSITPADAVKLGFDVQINDAKDGARQSAAAWNDTSGSGYMDTSVYGELTLTGKGGGSTGDGDDGADDGDGSGSSGSSGGAGGGSGGGGSAPQTGNVEGSNGTVTLKPELTTDSGAAKATVSSDRLKQALEQAKAAANGRKQVVIDVPQQAGAQSYELRLPAQSLQSQEAYVLLLQTEHATLEVPSSMLAGIGAADQVSIRVSHVNVEELDVSVREQIGSRPVIDLNVAADGKDLAWNNPKAPVTVSIPYSPTAEELRDPYRIVIWYINDEGRATPVPSSRYDAASGTVKFQTTHFSVYAITSVDKSFEDLKAVPWAQQAIHAMAARDMIQGTAEDRFSPDEAIKRAEFIALLVRALELQGTGENEAMFSDVRAGAYYYDELSIAQELGIVTGFENNTFQPDSTISRQDMMVLTTRALKAAGKKVEAGGALDAYSDAANVSDYAKASAAGLVKSGIIAGKNGRLAPNDSLTRAEAAVILYRIWER
ncbi:endo-1,4-beta-xylanase [Paenibacillus turpanensis]|uniref:endo-1,4-beta-xylanase n=1 Tax=Paenibacillus turpanensis TaxID=2689078 RepID=UPI00140E83E8|nr:endo-1,4-beta-xylanase [Paenibacillus turpanensis]